MRLFDQLLGGLVASSGASRSITLVSTWQPVLSGDIRVGSPDYSSSSRSGLGRDHLTPTGWVAQVLEPLAAAESKTMPC